MPHGWQLVYIVVAAAVSASSSRAAHLASFKKPTRVYFMDELPYTPTLKLARAVLREQLAESAA